MLLDLSHKAGERFNTTCADNLGLIVSPVSVYGTELVLNGAAEGHESQTMVPGWNAPYRSGTAEYTDAEECFNEADWCLPKVNGGAANRGDSFFHGTGQIADSAAYQTVDLTLIRDGIDAGSVSSWASAWLGGFNEILDEVSLQVSFLDASGRRGEDRPPAPVWKS